MIVGSLSLMSFSSVSIYLAGHYLVKYTHDVHHTYANQGMKYVGFCEIPKIKGVVFGFMNEMYVP